MKLIIHEVVDYGVDTTVEEAEPVDEKHCEEVVGLPQEATTLDLADESNDVERCPSYDEARCHHDHHQGYLKGGAE